jgi:hypothetical protein
MALYTLNNRAPALEDLIAAAIDCVNATPAIFSHAVPDEQKSSGSAKSSGAVAHQQ